MSGSTHVDEYVLVMIAATDSGDADVLAHLGQCSVCSRELDLCRKISDLVRASVDPSPPVTDRQVEKLFARIDGSESPQRSENLPAPRPRRRPRQRWRNPWFVPVPVVAAAAVVLVAVTMGIGPARTSSSALVLKTIRDSPALATTAFRTVRFSENTVLRASPGYTAVRYQERGAVDYRSNSFELTERTIEAGGPRLSTLTTVSNGSLVYLWCYVDGQIIGQCAAYPAQRGSSSDNVSLTYLREASGPVVSLGTRSIDGTETTGYRVTVPVDALAQNAVRSAQSLVQYDNTTTFDLRVAVWSDAQHLPRELVFTYQVYQPSLGTVLNGTSTEQLSYSKTPLHVQVPPTRAVILTPSLSAAVQWQAGNG